MRINALAFLSLTLLATTAIADESAHGQSIFSHFSLETGAGVTRREGATQTWDFRGWVGGDRDKFLLQSEGKRLDGIIEDATATALYSRNISEFWDAQIGIRQEFRPHNNSSLAVGFEGLAPYYFDTQIHLFISEKGYASLRLREENDLLFTQKLIVKPYAEAELSFANDEAQQRGKGFSHTIFGIQTRYEITRSFAPYVDVHYDRAFGRTAKFLAEEGRETSDDAVATLGIKLVF